MKFYVPEATDPNDTAADCHAAARQGNAYASYLASVRDRLPEPLRYIAERINFGDYLLEELDVDLEASIATLRIGGETITYLSEEKTFRFWFGGVTRCAITNEGDGGLFIAKSLVGANHEVEVIEPDRFEFRLLFHGGAELAIRFRECDWEVLPDEYGNVGLSPDVAEETAAIVGVVEKGKLDADVLRDLMARCAGGNAYVHYRFGKLAMDGRYYPLAIEQLTIALNDTTNYKLGTLFLLAKTKYLSGDFAGVSLLLDEVLRENPKHPGALRYRALVGESHRGTNAPANAFQAG